MAQAGGEGGAGRWQGGGMERTSGRHKIKLGKKEGGAADGEPFVPTPSVNHCLV